MPLNLKSVANGSVILNPASTVTDKTITLPATDGTMVVQDGTNTTTINNLAYTGTLTGGTGVINIGSGQLVKDTSGNLGLGVTPSAWSGLGTPALQTANGVSLFGFNNGAYLLANTYYNSGYKYIATAAASRYEQSGGAHAWFTAPSGTAGNAISFTQAMTLSAAGDLGIGTTSNIASSKLDVRGRIRAGSGNSSGDAEVIWSNYASATTAWSVAVRQDVGGANNDLKFLRFDSSGAYQGVAMQLDSSGNLLVGATSFGGGATRGFQINATSTASNAYAQLIKDNNGTEIFQMRCNGGLANYSANNANLSDERVKTDIKLADSYLDKICAIPVKTFKYKNQTDDLLNLGVIAQDVEAVAPELVDINGFGETPDDGIPLKAIYQTDLQYALMKALQELKAEFDAYKAAHP